MIIGLEEKIENYSVCIKSKRPDYPALYKFFCEYLNAQPQYNLIDVDAFFTRQCRELDIINAAIYYVEKSNALTKTAITKFLNAMSKMYRDIIEPYHNQTLKNSMPFSKLAPKVECRVNKDLAEAKTNPPISEEEYNMILDYFKYCIRGDKSQLKIEIIFKFLLLYGFKMERLINMKRTDYDRDKRRLIVERSSGNPIALNVPFQLVKKLEEYLTYVEKDDNTLMFCSRNGNPITPASLHSYFRGIEKRSPHKSYAFTSTGLAKFAIIKLIDKKINLVTIKEITGMEDIVIADCTLRYFKKINVNKDASEIDRVDTFTSWNDVE